MPKKPNKIGTKWEPALPIRKHDNIIASQQFKNLKPFNVSYEMDGHVNMNFIMGWEYGRIWHTEKKKWETMNYGAPESTGQTELLRRKYVLRSPKKSKNK